QGVLRSFPDCRRDSIRNDELKRRQQDLEPAVLNLVRIENQSVHGLLALVDPFRGEPIVRPVVCTFWVVLPTQKMVDATDRLVHRRIRAKLPEPLGKLRLERCPEVPRSANIGVRRQPFPARLSCLAAEVPGFGHPLKADHCSLESDRSFVTIQRGQNGSCPGRRRSSSLWMASGVLRSSGKAPKSFRIHASAASIASSACFERACRRPKTSDTSQPTASPCFAQRSSIRTSRPARYR